MAQWGLEGRDWVSLDAGYREVPLMSVPVDIWASCPQ